MALTREQKERLEILPHQLIEYELTQIEWYKEQIAWYESIAEKWPQHADQAVEGIRLMKDLIAMSSKIIEKEQDNARTEATLDAGQDQRTAS